MRQRDEQKELLIKQKAIEMIVREGLEGFGVNKLAKAADVSPGTIYIYYKDKEDLLLTLCQEISSNILESSLKGLRADMPFEQGMRLQWKNRYQFFKKAPLQVQFIEKVRYSSIYEKIPLFLNESYGKLLADFLYNAIERKELAQLSFELYWSLSFAPLYQLINFSGQVSSDGKSKFIITQSILDEALNHVLKGLKP